MNTREKVLELLEDHRGEYISGEQISDILKISRTAVWKCVSDLRKAGYRIDASTKRGYMLSDDAEVVTADVILKYISDRACVTKDSLFVFEELPSTNDLAKKMASEGAPSGTVLIAKRQTKGRGRFSRTFYSPSGGLYMSIILRPELPGGVKCDHVTSFAAVCVSDAIEETSGSKTQIKWVNDIYMSGRKVSGILTEASIDMETNIPEWIVIGIGINIQGREEDLPEEIKGKAGYVFGDEKPTFAIPRLAGRIIDLILANTAADGEIMEKYREKVMYIGEKVKVISGNDSYEAVPEDVDGEGHLIVRDGEGNLHVLFAGEISIIKT